MNSRAQRGTITTRLTLPLADGIVEEIAVLLVQGESRVAFIRAAIDREIERRKGIVLSMEAAE